MYRKSAVVDKRIRFKADPVIFAVSRKVIGRNGDGCFAGFHPVIDDYFEGGIFGKRHFHCFFQKCTAVGDEFCRFIFVL